MLHLFVYEHTYINGTEYIQTYNDDDNLLQDCN